jgi:hypothetical protein
MPAREIDDRQAAMAEDDARHLIDTFVIGPSMSQCSQHLLVAFADAREIPHRACDTTHSVHAGG